MNLDIIFSRYSERIGVDKSNRHGTCWSATLLIRNARRHSQVQNGERYRHLRLLCDSDQLPESRMSCSADRKWFGDGSGRGSCVVRELMGGKD